VIEFGDEKSNLDHTFFWLRTSEPETFPTIGSHAIQIIHTGEAIQLVGEMFSQPISQLKTRLRSRLFEFRKMSRFRHQQFTFADFVSRSHPVPLTFVCAVEQFQSCMHKRRAFSRTHCCDGRHVEE
jgi:hypothetical protein